LKEGKRKQGSRKHLDTGRRVGGHVSQVWIKPSQYEAEGERERRRGRETVRAMIFMLQILKLVASEPEKHQQLSDAGNIHMSTNKRTMRQRSQNSTTKLSDISIQIICGAATALRYCRAYGSVDLLYAEQYKIHATL
jgi:hypothetical protein